MNHSLKIRVLSLILAFVMIIGYLPINAFATESEPTEPSSVATEPSGEVTEPEVTEPEVTEPEVTEPEVTEPEVTEPEVTEPEVTEPEVTEPEVTEPITAQYKVEHYLETAEGYILDEAATETLTGAIGAATAAVAKEYKGYTVNPFEQGVIAEDGSTVIKIYYTKDPIAIGATANGLPGDMAMVSNKVSTLAPGIVERQITALDKNGDQVLMYVATADPAEETVKVYANYMNNQNKVWGMQKTTEQAAAFEAKHEGENVIVAINASYFNTSNGAPTGAFVMEGMDASTSGDNYSFFALLKNGTYMIGAKGEYSSYKGQIQEAIGGYIHLVNDGKIMVNPDNDKYPRQTIGLTADGKIVIMMADCLNSVGSAGLTIYEQAEVMLSLGCVEAIHLDGGGSGTYCSKQAGADKLEVTNNPSNGTERAVSNTLILVSTAKPDGEFDSAQLTAEHAYITPGSAVEISAVGLDSSKGAAEIPADVSWRVADSTMGTAENGVFTSSGIAGDAVVQMVHDGKVVGETVVHIVNPTQIDFGGRSTVVIPNNSTIELPVKAYYGTNPVYFNDNDFNVVLGNAAVATSGLNVTAPAADSGISGTTVTVSLKADETISFTASLVFGKASEVVFSFEEDTEGADINNWILRTHEYNDDRYNEQGDIKIVTAETGKVHSGGQALAFRADFSQTTGNGTTTNGYNAMSICWGGDAINVKGAQKIGFWVYVPEGATAVEFTMNTVYYAANGTPGRRTVDCMDDNGELIYTPYWSTKMEESGWQYVEADFSAFKDDLLIKDEPGVPKGYKNNFLIKIYCASGAYNKDLADYFGDFTFYIDDITVDYSSAVEDRKLPVFSNFSANGSGSTKALEYGKTVDIAENSLTFNANVVDNTTGDNYVGLDASTAKIYVDGYSIGATYTNGLISSNNVVLADGYHRITFEMADNNGNTESITREINVVTGSELATVKLVPQDPSLDRLLSDSVYWADLVSEDIANVKSLKAVLRLNSNSDWELDNMVVADGFAASYYYASAADKAENIVTLLIERNGEDLDPNNTVIASLPIRVWESLVHTNKTHASKTPAAQWAGKDINHRLMSVTVKKGQVAFVDDSTAFFSGKIIKDHEGYEDGYLLDTTYWSEKNANGGFHVHTVTTLDDLAATCTEKGYTGRTFCEVCNSVVAWGTTVAATGHTYEIGEDGILDCACGVTFTGVHTDGKEYVDGVCVADGWNGDSYYVGGEKLTGIHKVPAPDASGEFYYNFGEDGVCAGQAKYIGLFYDESVSAYRYAKLGVLQSGWIQIEGKWHYFDSTTMNAVTGDYYYAARGVTYHFDETGMTEGAWQKTKEGTRFWYGKWYYQATGNRVCFAEIDGKTYNFDKNGYMTTGIHALYWDWTSDQRKEMRVWEFDENGILVREITEKGLVYADRGDVYLIEEDGFVHGGHASGRLTEYDGNLYFVVFSGKLKQNASQKITAENSNGLLPNGTYYFGEDCKLFTGIKAESDGYLYYYQNGQIAVGAYNSELAEINEEIYLVKWSGKVAMNETRDVAAAKTNGLLPAGTYYFDADGKAILPTGIIKGNDGLLYYYKDGKLQTTVYNSELVEIDGEIYLVKWSGKVAANEVRVIPASKTNGLLAAGTYYFGADGKLYNGPKEESDGLLYYYENGQKVKQGTYNSELVEYNGHIYLVKWSGKVAFNETRVIPADKTNGLLAAGTYYFGADGKLFTGVMAGADGILYYYQNGQLGNGKYNSELVKIDDAIYLVKWSGKVAVNETRAVTAAKANGLVEAGTYTFGADGKLQK